MEHRVATLLRDGEAAARNGDRAEARRAFRAVLTRHPTNVAALLWMAWLSDDPRARLTYADRALNLDPDNRRAHAARKWAASGLDAATHGSSSSESLEPKPARGWRKLLPLAALGSFGAFLAGMFLVILWYAPRGFPIIAAPEAASSSTPAVASLPSPTPSPSVTPSPPATVTAANTPTRTPTVTRSIDPTLSPTATARPTQASPSPSPSPSPSLDDLSPARSSVGGNVRWINVDLGRQTLTAYEGHTPVRSTLVSTGLPRTPTPVGKYYVYVKFLRDDMRGPDYYLRDVPYTMYFYRGYGIHGTYWHANFGYPMSHGCINLPTEEAEWLFNWASVGTLVNIHP